MSKRLFDELMKSMKRRKNPEQSLSDTRTPEEIARAMVKTFMEFKDEMELTDEQIRLLENEAGYFDDDDVAGIYEYFEYSSIDSGIRIDRYIGSATDFVEIPPTIDYAPVISIGDDAFKECTSLKAVSIPDSVTEIGRGAFAGCSSLQEMFLPDSVKEIGIYAFAGCKSLHSISLPASLTEIAPVVFSACFSLELLITPTGERDIYKDHPNFMADDQFVYAKVGSAEVIINSFIGTNPEVTIPRTFKKFRVIGIGACVFDSFSWITSITIPDSVVFIDWAAFSRCTSLKSINIPASVTEIDIYTFMGCTALESVTIPGSVTRIGENAFMGCTSLKSVTVPKSAEIGNGAFEAHVNIVEAKDVMNFSDNVIGFYNAMLGIIPGFRNYPYDFSDSWVYLGDNNVRYVLGKPGKNNMLVLGVNPSTAVPESSDATINRVSSILAKNGYDGWIMMNLYPQRATNTENEPLVENAQLIRNNLAVLEFILDNLPISAVWCAWGNPIDKFKFLRKSLEQIQSVLKTYGVKCYHYGELTANKNPRHPLYASNDWKFELMP